MRKLLRAFGVNEALGMGKHSPQRLEQENAKFEEWRKQNPDKKFTDYFAEGVKPPSAAARASDAPPPV